MKAFHELTENQVSIFASGLLASIEPFIDSFDHPPGHTILQREEREKFKEAIRRAVKQHWEHERYNRQVVEAWEEAKKKNPAKPG